jgi:hypothetical protein
MPADSAAQAIKPSVKPVLIGLLVFDLIGLVPWAVFSALSFMGFDSGFHWNVVFLMAPFWIYPILVLVCAIVAFSLNAKGRTSEAIGTMLGPVIVSGGWFWLLLNVAPLIAKHF